LIRIVETNVHRATKLSGWRKCFVLLAPAAVLATRSQAQETSRVSVDSTGAQGSGWLPAISSDGLYVAFESASSNLVAKDTNMQPDVFVHDRMTGTTERVSVDSTGAQANDWCSLPSISADGIIVAFCSPASNLVAGDSNGLSDIFVRDRGTGLTERVSVDSSGAESDGDSFASSISADGRFVVFESDATNLVAADTNGVRDVFLHDRSTGVTTRISVDSSGSDGNGSSDGPSISSDGSTVVFMSNASNLVPYDTNGMPDIFVRDIATSVTERVSVDSSGGEANLFSSVSSISGDGRVIAFDSVASNLVVSDTNGMSDVFVHDRTTGITERVSVDSSGTEAAWGGTVPWISADGRTVAFQSYADDLVAGDTNSIDDVFVHDLSSGRTERVSVDSFGVQGNGFSYSWGGGGVSADGSLVVFYSASSNLVAGDTNGAWDVFVRERCVLDATWSNYGAGFPGSNGVPGLTAQSDPELDSPLTIALSNSYGSFTVGLVFVGFQQGTFHSSWGGDLLVVPAITLVVGLPPSGTTLTGNIPNEAGLCGFEIDLQALESDAGAAKGVSFTQGLELELGQ
jgi:Tol biopolymer transport system component